MRKLLKQLEDTVRIGIIYLIISILMYVFLLVSERTTLNTNVYYFLEQLSRLFSVVICYNILPKSLRILTLIFGTITIMRLVNQVLYLANFIDVNNPILLSTEFILTLIIVWLISKYHSE
jgi:hypothetical protein